MTTFKCLDPSIVEEYRENNPEVVVRYLYPPSLAKPPMLLPKTSRNDTKSTATVERSNKFDYKTFGS